MGAISGPISFSRFVVRGDVPKRYADSFMRSIKLRAFRPLALEDEDEERTGWCAAGSPLDIDPSRSVVVVNEYLLLALRVDKWRLPKAHFKAHFEHAAQEMQQRTGRDTLSKREKDELKFRVTRRLRKKVLPQMRHFDLVWDLNQRSLLFWSRTESIKEQLVALFEKTFKLTLDEYSPYVAARELVELTLLERLASAEQSSFHDPQMVSAIAPEPNADEC